MVALVAELERIVIDLRSELDPSGPVVFSFLIFPVATEIEIIDAFLILSNGVFLGINLPLEEVVLFLELRYYCF
jgi:hypothetical protein